MKNLLLVGAPGSGKGTQSQRLKEQGYTHLSMGDLLRDEVASGSELGVEINALISKGNFVTDELALKLFKKTVQPDKAYIFDGFPRTVPQAKAFVEAFKNIQVIYFDLKLDTLKDRLVYRRTCPECGAIFNLKLHPPKAEDTCSCGHIGLSHRQDDKEEFFETRWRTFMDKTMPLIGVLDQASFVRLNVNADQSEDQIYKDIQEFLKN
jgi:adenylate kinase